MDTQDEITEYWVLAYYFFADIADPEEMVREHKRFCEAHAMRGRVYFAREGINGTVSAPRPIAQSYMDWLRGQKLFAGITFKLQTHHEHVFEKMIVKVRPELVALGRSVDRCKGGEYLTPAAWRKALEGEDEKIILDVRNDYEWKLGHFEGAERLPCTTFKEFRDYAALLRERTQGLSGKNPPKVLMYCTGGIRCELFSALLKEEGIDEVYQLEGGILNYGVEEKSRYWLGRLFVFDDRLSIPISDEEAPVIGRCHHCATESETYYNCANMDCNELFLCCESCLRAHVGCCCATCQQGMRLRPYKLSAKPFRRWYHYADTKEALYRLAGKDVPQTRKREPL